MPVLLYGCETWAITQVDILRLNTFHMRCIRSISGVSRLNKIRNSFNLKSAKNQLNVKFNIKDCSGLVIYNR